VRLVLRRVGCPPCTGLLNDPAADAAGMLACQGAGPLICVSVQEWPYGYRLTESPQNPATMMMVALQCGICARVVGNSFLLLSLKLRPCSF
jgi:hypothetical protein